MRNIRQCCVRRSGGPYPPGGGCGGTGDGAAGAAPIAVGKRRKGCASVVRQELQAPAVIGLGPAPGGEHVRKRTTGKNRAAAGTEVRSGNPAARAGSQRADQGETPEMAQGVRRDADGKTEAVRRAFAASGS